MFCTHLGLKHFRCLVFLALVILLGGCGLLQEMLAQNQASDRVRVFRVVDGDTVNVRFWDGREERLRLIGVDAPEINHPTKGEEPFGSEAKEYAREVLENKEVWLEFDRGERDRYGRLLAYLWLEKPDQLSESEIRSKMFNARLLLDGYALQVVFEPNTRYENLFSRYESEARQAKKGLWAFD